jgi:hypothetical protein
MKLNPWRVPARPLQAALWACKWLVFLLVVVFIAGALILDDLTQAWELAAGLTAPAACRCSGRAAFTAGALSVLGYAAAPAVIGASAALGLTWFEHTRTTDRTDAVGKVETFAEEGNELEKGARKAGGATKKSKKAAPRKSSPA